MTFKQLLRTIRIFIGKQILDKKTPCSKGSISNIKRILFLRQDGKIGDYIVSSFVFRELKKQYPNIHIGVVCLKQNSYLFSQNKYIDKLYIIKKRSIPDIIKFGMNIRQQKYDVVIDPTIFIRNRDLLLLRLINAKNYIGYKKDNYNIFNIDLEGEYHFSEIYRLALSKINIEVQNTNYDVPYNEKESNEIDTFLRDKKISNFIAINFYGAARIKKVSDENIIKYLKYLTKITNKQIVLLTYPEVTSKLLQFSDSFDNVFVYKNTSTIFHTIELIKNCDLLVSTDTSTIHIASGFNKKIIGMYKEDNISFIHWQPKSKAETHILFYKNNINELRPEQILPEWL